MNDGVYVKNHASQGTMSGKQSSKNQPQTPVRQMHRNQTSEWDILDSGKKISNERKIILRKESNHDESYNSTRRGVLSGGILSEESNRRAMANIVTNAEERIVID